MSQIISLREFNHHIADYVKAAEEGEKVIITRRGKPIAQLTSVEKTKKLSSNQMQAWNELKEWMDKGLKSKGKRLTRDELHERK